jgi:hypothetical protein
MLFFGSLCFKNHLPPLPASMASRTSTRRPAMVASNGENDAAGASASSCCCCLRCGGCGRGRGGEALPPPAFFLAAAAALAWPFFPLPALLLVAVALPLPLPLVAVAFLLLFLLPPLPLPLLVVGEAPGAAALYLWVHEICYEHGVNQKNEQVKTRQGNATQRTHCRPWLPPPPVSPCGGSGG